MALVRNTQPSDFNGLEWVRNLWGSKPRWAVNLDEEAIKQTVQSALELPAPCDIEFLAQGAFNKLYTIKSTGKEVVARVTLPADPIWKTLSEVATLKWVRENASLPVPEVLAYQADRASAIGFEWIAMTKMPGKPLAERWWDISFPAKEEIVRQLALFCSDIFGHRIVSAAFIWDDHIHQDIPRGPFESSKDWLSARLTLAQNDCRKRLSRFQEDKRDASHEGAKTEGMPEEETEDEEEEEEDNLEELEHTMDIISRLRSRLDEFFPTKSPEPEPTMILHDDLSRHNILVNEDGMLTGVVDWECISALPLWIACQFPSILQGKPLDERPIKSRYHHDENGKNYELTQLRRLFLEEMRRLQPTWVEIFESSQRQRDFDLAVASCDDSFLIRRIRNWLDDIDLGVKNLQGLEERIDNASL
ncbi:phosphotransferase enzyme family-domain-containing protein [Phialemonium atrogriseum]|uniref:Phosphotransferase enzyme family-domain-containing protein n=1 Tax=Phialemonium atrogriseum TaxID=1093897 RepID=A0AAJ0C045_9PEZI|nr:phosphotransferase enzyme family-domain-containing protein [Phialemonium atrogriseum]KAK1767446.1 phosphotransferase enzyme family-domain-containing protein [Phialemonium atrogriseum]